MATYLDSRVKDLGNLITGIFLEKGVNHTLIHSESVSFSLDNQKYTVRIRIIGYLELIPFSRIIYLIFYVFPSVSESDVRIHFDDDPVPGHVLSMNIMFDVKRGGGT